LSRLLANLVMLLAAVLTVGPGVTPFAAASPTGGSLPAAPAGFPDRPAEDTSDESPSVREGEVGLLTARRTRSSHPARGTAQAKTATFPRSHLSGFISPERRIPPVRPDRTVLHCCFTL